MANRIRTGDPRGFNKGRSLKFGEGSQVRQTPKEGQRTYQPKRCGNNYKNEDSPKTLNDKTLTISCKILILFETKDTRILLFLVELHAIKMNIIRFYLLLFYQKYWWGSPHSIVVNELNCNIIVIKFKFQLYYVQFWTKMLGKGMNLFISPAVS